MKTGLALLPLVLVACGVAAISDRYGNRYGDWYNPGSGFRWQLDLWEHQLEAQATPLPERKLAMPAACTRTACRSRRRRLAAVSGGEAGAAAQD